MKVIVKEHLDVRVGRPSINAPSYQNIAPGSQLEVEGKLFHGDILRGVNTWLKDAANNYYWSGSIENIDEIIARAALTEFSESDFWWHKDFNIGELWRKGLSGEKVKLAVLDSGIALPHPDLIVNTANFMDLSASGTGITDQTGHGTHVTGIIKASNNGFGVKGLAFNTDFYLGKITNDIHGDDVQFLVKGVEWAIKNSVDIISISNGVSANNSALETAVGKAIAKGILIIAAAGNRDSTTGNDILYPARYENVLSVAGITKSKFPLADTIHANKTNIFAPGEEIFSTFLNKAYVNLSGSSQAAPYVAGIAALLLEAVRKKNKKYRAHDLREELMSHADSVEYGKLINPVNTLNKL
ncbi:S8 family serine peptidase [Ohtaekwangia koreensis]|uniref:Subtilase family protein n=1 Tax=Ohtaekwangia koreensis TaxID=688867 RepID=A0A1T5L6Q3_9BACT|nr:S8 family serine peptidase [Ohtaekwangia koreensis]SKC71651.1 Subtilase family protein [Ohtaekwangia koreensis]